ncbi:PREDICTED: uncharacterized protein LOC109338611 [Lupinus angustifolius]|uniref:uncharacterized protein LOC109338611 n=1 Tax=Lupinus angustifolius TaxID=3871 RepID=UPI00092EF735|nr:PREDICTED: uncharacterized protein LOC109338611 [Lupinus angustifolius]
MNTAKSTSTSMRTSYKLTKTGSEQFEDLTLYRSIVGALQYATITRPDLAFRVNKVCQFMSKPLHQHWSALKRILRYQRGSSTLGACIFLGPNIVTWWSKKQQTISRSSIEAEYRSLALATQEVIWIESLFS